MFVNMKGRKISMFIHEVFQLEACWFSPQCWDGIEWLYYQINLGAWLCSSNDFPVNFMYSSLIVIVYYHHHYYHEIPNWQRATSWLFARPPRIWIYNICMKTQHPDHWAFSPLDFIIKSFDVYSRQQLVLANARTNGSQSRFLQTLALQWCSAVSGRDQIPCPQKHPFNVVASIWENVHSRLFREEC